MTRLLGLSYVLMATALLTIQDLIAAEGGLGSSIVTHSMFLRLMLELVTTTLLKSPVDCKIFPT